MNLILSQILHKRDSIISDIPPRDDSSYNPILKQLQNAWQEYDSSSKSIAISLNIFQVKGQASYLSRVAAEKPVMMLLDMLTI